MIPHRVSPKENAGNALRYRVAACRKRLRTIRATHKTQIHIDMDEDGELESLFPAKLGSSNHLDQPFAANDDDLLLLAGAMTQDAEIT
jgi:hypothetical protein